MSDYSRTMLESVTDPMREPPIEEPQLVFFDGLEDALVGLGRRFTRYGHVQFAVYDYSKCIEILLRDSGADECTEQQRLEAEEHMAFNVIGCYAGDTTPAFLMPVEE